MLGNVDSGKSTLLGVLTQGELDNGRGRARLNLFRHLHEIQSGRTSSISFEILGFNSKGEVSERAAELSWKWLRWWRRTGLPSCYSTEGDMREERWHSSVSP